MQNIIQSYRQVTQWLTEEKYHKTYLLDRELELRKQIILENSHYDIKYLNRELEYTIRQVINSERRIKVYKKTLNNIHFG